MDSFYVICRACGKVHANEYSEYERGFIVMGKLRGQSLLDCKRCGRASHLVYTSVEDIFDQCALRWQYATAVTVDGNFKTERWYAEKAKELYATRLIPSPEVIIPDA